MQDVVVAGHCRTAVGTFGGSLKDISATELAVLVMKEALARSGMTPDMVDSVVLGNVENSPREGLMARVAGIRAGIPKDIPAYHVNRLCGSGMQAIHNGTDFLQLGKGRVVIAGGVETMSRYRFALERNQTGYRMGDQQLHDTLWEILADRERDVHGAYAAENLARQYGISREEQDIFSIESHRRAVEATKAGRFAQEIVPVEIKTRSGIQKFDRDEHMRENVNMEQLSKIRPIFKDGTVTAGNACGINDGASAMVLTTEGYARDLNINPLARIVATSVTGCDPDFFPIGPVPAILKVLGIAGLQQSDIGLFEINEAFAVQVLAVEKELGLDPLLVNVNGGAVALGHALGNSGTRISITLIEEMRRRGVRYGISSLCIGYGMGIATIWENVG